MTYKLKIIIFGHILNPLWKPHSERRRIRGEVTRKAIDEYLDSYIDFIEELRPDAGNDAAKEPHDRIFSMWIQGEESAPDIVKTCWESIRTNCPQELIIVDSKNLDRWIELPGHIIKKWEEGKMKPAHFADICRLALLVRHGGLWADATAFIPKALPQWLWDTDFFVYLSGHVQRGWYSFIQNCFIRSKQDNFLADAWLKLIYEYWRREDRPADYFIHQMLFRKLVENNPLAKALFETMPKLNQDATHALWFENGNQTFDAQRWESLLSDAMFQKTEYKSKMARSPKPGSFAEHLINIYKRK